MPRRLRVTPKTRRLVEHAYQLIREQLLKCEIPPGAELFEQRLADEIRVSKTPVREALHRLVSDGLVEVRPRRGYVATQVTVRDVQEIFQLRLLLEPAAAEMAARVATFEQLEELERLASGQTSGDNALFPGEHFHEMLARASGDRRLHKMLRGLLDETARVFNLLELTGKLEVPPHAHNQLVGALLERNAARAKQIRIRDITTTRESVIHRMLTDPSGRRIQLARAETRS